MRFLVTGGTGTLGKELVPRLVLGHDVRVFTRRSMLRTPDETEYAHGNVLDPASLDAAMVDVDVVVHCATARRRRYDVDVTGTANVVEAARRAGVAHLLFMSMVGVDRNPFPYYRAKLAAESAVQGGDVPWTILRSTNFHDQLDQALHSANQVPVVLPVPMGFRFQPVSTAEVAERLVMLALGRPAGRAPDIGGPEVRRIDDLARHWVVATGGRKRVVRVPVPGRTGRAFRDGTVLTPDHAAGRATWEQYLAYRYGT